MHLIWVTVKINREPAAAAPLWALPAGQAGLLRFLAGLAERQRPPEEPGQLLGPAVPESEPGTEGGVWNINTEQVKQFTHHSVLGNHAKETLSSPQKNDIC